MSQPHTTPTTLQAARALAIVPADGRDYRTAIETLIAWKAGTLFTISDLSSPRNGEACSCRDFTRVDNILIRFNRQRDSLITGGLASFFKPAARRQSGKRRYRL